MLSLNKDTRLLALILELRYAGGRNPLYEAVDPATNIHSMELHPINVWRQHRHSPAPTNACSAGVTAPILSAQPGGGKSTLQR